MIRVYRYGLLPPILNVRIVADQMRLVHRYRNVLIEIERERRIEVAELLAGHPDGAELQSQIGALVAERDAARAAIKVARAAARARSDDGSQRAHVRELGARIAELRAKAKAARREFAQDAAVRAGLAEIAARAADRAKAARKTCGVYWGTYLLAEQAMDAAKKAATPPEFVSRRPGGAVSVQLQGGVSVDELGGDTQLQVRPHLASGQSRPSTHDCNRILRVRVASDERSPVWAEWPIRMHRPLPDGVRIKVATVSCRHHGSRVEWSVAITVDNAMNITVTKLGGSITQAVVSSWLKQVGDRISAGEPVAELETDGTAIQVPSPAAGVLLEQRVQVGATVEVGDVIGVVETHAYASTAPPGGVCALNLGFALRPDGIRVGYVVGDDGHEQEILMPDQIRRSIDKADSIRGFRDRDLNALKIELRAWISGQPEDGVPEWFVLRTSRLALWRSPGAFAALREQWQRGWWDDGDAGYAIIDRWFARDLHLERYETGMRRTALRRRTDHYRVVAATLARRYRTLVVDDTDLREFQESPATESEDVERAPVKRQQRLAAGSELRSAMVNAFHGRVVKLSSADVTVVHAACGHRNARVLDSRELVCGGCGVPHDQDANACRNLLRERLGADGGGEIARAAKAADRKPSRGERLSAARRRGRIDSAARTD